MAITLMGIVGVLSADITIPPYESTIPKLDQPWYFNPFSLAMGADNYIYTGDFLYARVVKLDPDGVFIKDWHPTGATSHQYCYVATDPQGNVYTSTNNVVKKFDPEGNLLSSWTVAVGGGYSAYALAVDNLGNFYITDRGANKILKYNSAGVLITQWGSTGTGDGQFNSPCGIALDSARNVYVCEYTNHRVQKFDSDGTFITKWGSSGSADGKFSYPTAIAIDREDKVYVTDLTTGRIQKFDSNGNFLVKVGTAFRSPQGLAVDSLGNIYVTSSSDTNQQQNVQIEKFNPSGVKLSTWGPTGSTNGFFYYPRGVALDSSGNLYVADGENDRIQKFSAGGVFDSSWYVSGNPTGITIDPFGNVYVLAGGIIQKYAPTGELLLYWGSSGSADGQFNQPWDVDTDTLGNVYVVDTANNRIQKFNSNGVFITKWGSAGSADGQFQAPFGIAIDSSNNVYIADYGNNRIQKFNSNGVFITKWGSYGSADGQLISPAAIDVDDSGNVYVSDDNSRIQVFSSDGIFLAKFGSFGWQEGQFGRYIRGLITNNEGSVIYVSDTNNHRIQQFGHTVNNVNHPPVLDTIGNKILNEGEALIFTISATDEDAEDILSFTATEIPTGAAFDADTRKFTWDSPVFGSYPVTFTVSDGAFSDSETITITVNNVNHAPVFDAVSDQVVDEGETLEFTLTATDPDGDELTIEADSLPGGAAFNGATFSWVTDSEMAGEYDVGFTVSDGDLTNEVTVHITINNVNLLPEAIFDYAPGEIYTGDEVQFTDSSSDPDGSIDSWSWDFGDGETSAEQNPVHIYTEAGTYTVTMRVTDNDSDSAMMDVEIGVMSSNHAPVFDPIEDQVVDEGETVEFTLTATDPDGDELTIEADSLPGGASFNGATFTWVTDYTQAGSYNVMFTVTDGSLTDSINVGIVMNEVAPQEAIENLEDYIVNLNLDKGITNSLTAKLGAAISSLDRGNENAALNQLNAFINSVEAQRGKKLTNEQADALILEVNRIISGI